MLLKGSVPSTPMTRGEFFSAKASGGHSTNWAKWNRKTAFTWYWPEVWARAEGQNKRSVRTKLQAPNTKRQGNFKLKAPERSRPRRQRLALGVRRLPGASRLGLGAFCLRISM